MELSFGVEVRHSVASFSGGAIAVLLPEEVELATVGTTIFSVS